jgi:cellulose synthase (UDP-forming)
VAVLHGTEFQSFRIGTDVYHVGVLQWWMQIELWFMQYPYMIAVVIFALTFLLAVWARLWLRAKARARLKMMEE